MRLMDQADPIRDTTHPKRFYWLKRFAIAGLVLLVLLIGLRLAWGQRVQSRLDQAIADIHAKGEPIQMADFAFEPLDDADNGAWYLAQALQQWPTLPGTPGQRITDTDWHNEGEEAGFTDPITDNAAYLATCQPVLDLIRQAAACEEADWDVQLVRPTWDILLPHLGEMRELMRLVDDVAERALHVGDTQLTLEAILLQQAIARHVTRRNISLIEYLVGLSIVQTSSERIERCLPHLNPADLREGESRALANELIQQYTDDFFSENMIRSMVGERVSNHDLYEGVIDGTFSASDIFGYGDPMEWMIDTPGTRQAIMPAIKNEQLLTTQALTDMIEGLKSNVPGKQIEQIDEAINDKLNSNSLLYPLNGAMFGVYGRVYYYNQRNQAFRHCAAVAIAIKLYEADQGQRPDTLAQLVPEYLPAIPTDPFSPTGEPIKYKPAGIIPGIDSVYRLTGEQVTELKRRVIRPYPIVYSIGMDNQDSFGQFMIVSELGELNDTRWSNTEDVDADIWFMLDAWPEAIFAESDLQAEDDLDLDDMPF